MAGRTIYVVDEDDLSRRMLSLEISTLGFDPWPFPSAASLLGMIAHLEPACVVIGAGAANMNGLPLLAELANRVTWPAILVGEKGDFRLAYDAMKLGALDFVQKPVDPVALRELLAVAEAKLQRIAAAGLVERTARERVGRLTRRELEIGMALMNGLSNKVAAHQLGISVRTVEMHRAQILRKLGVRNLAEGVVLLYQAGLAAPAPEDRGA